MTTTSWSNGLTADKSGPIPGPLPFPASTPHGETGVSSPVGGKTSATRVALAHNLSSSVSWWMSAPVARATARN